ncbi:unnamed protein product [Closterium sp. Naga37s-1]|nr:unnamed protein product [Closterium sp. Naga37s-1]
MAPAEMDQSPFERMFDLETIPESPDSGDMTTAFDSFLNLQAVAFPWTAHDTAGRRSGGKNGEAKASNAAAQRAARKQLLAALMEALADSADDTAAANEPAAAADEPSSPESLDEREFLSPAALAAGSRKRKAAEIEMVPSTAATVVGGSEADVTRELRRAIAAVILRSEPRPAHAAAAAPAPPVAAALPVVTTHATPAGGRTFAHHGPLQMPFRLPIANGAAPAASPAPEAAACMNYDNSDDDMGGFGGSPTRRGANGAADDADDWMPRNRRRKDLQMVGGRIKARSMAERQRRERISEGLQKLRLVVQGHGDTANMLHKAVAYVDALQRMTSQEVFLPLLSLRANEGSGPVEECEENVGKLRKLRFEAESTSHVVICVEECEENVGKLRKLRFEAENKFDATHAMGEKMKEKMAECEETTAKNAAERHKEKSKFMAQVHELENKVKELQAKLGTSDDTSSDGSTSDDTSSDSNLSDK